MPKRLTTICTSKITKNSRSRSGASHLCSPPLEIGVLRQEAEGKRNKERGTRKEPEEGRSQKKYFYKYKYEMLPRDRPDFSRLRTYAETGFFTKISSRVRSLPL
ncbi:MULTISPECIES: hypothetical protein [unclassified Microcoleus]|uniref:hypothetical protein n=1 Tax=unclassified Microcoleus TaxID=2642155 RepID=UPI002FD79C2C